MPKIALTSLLILCLSTCGFCQKWFPDLQIHLLDEQQNPIDSAHLTYASSVDTITLKNIGNGIYEIKASGYDRYNNYLPAGQISIKTENFNLRKVSLSQSQIKNTYYHRVYMSQAKEWLNVCGESYPLLQNADAFGLMLKQDADVNQLEKNLRNLGLTTNCNQKITVVKECAECHLQDRTSEEYLTGLTPRTNKDTLVRLKDIRNPRSLVYACPLKPMDTTQMGKAIANVSELEIVEQVSLPFRSQMEYSHYANQHWYWTDALIPEFSIQFTPNVDEKRITFTKVKLKQFGEVVRDHHGSLILKVPVEQLMELKSIANQIAKMDWVDSVYNEGIGYTSAN